jgi:hypothetical protein
MKALIKTIIAITALSFSCAGFACTHCSNWNTVGGKTVVFLGDTVHTVGKGIGHGAHAILHPTMKVTHHVLWGHWHH